MNYKEKLRTLEDIILDLNISPQNPKKSIRETFLINGSYIFH